MCATTEKNQKFLGSRRWVTYRKNEAVLEVGELFVTLFAAEHAILLVDHFFVAVLAGTGLVKAVFLAQVHYGSCAGVVVCLKREYKQTNIHVNKSSVLHNVTGMCFLLDVFPLSPDLFVLYVKYDGWKPGIKQHEINIKMTF